MRNRRWPLLFSAAGSVLVVVSLSLPWRAASCGGTGSNYFSGAANGPKVGLINLLDCSSFSLVEGWSFVGDAAALASVLLAALVAWAIFVPGSGNGVPLGRAGLLVAYLTVAVAAETRIEAHQIAREGVHLHVAYGTYVGLAGAVFALAAALGGTGKPSRSPRTLLAAGLLVALLLPWERDATASVTQLGIASSPGVVAAVLAIVLVASADRAAAALGAALFALAAADVGYDGDRAYGAWVGLAVAALLILASAREAAGVRRLRPTPIAAATGAAAAVFVVSLFLPWQDACDAHARCVSADGFGLIGSTAALVAAVMLLPAARSVSRGELAAAFALLAATLGFQLQRGVENGVRLSFGYGAIVGLVAATVLVVTALAPVRGTAISASLRVVPVVLAIAYVIVVVLPWWGVLPDSLWGTFMPRPAAASWLSVASALLGVRLVRAWAGADRAAELLAVSLVVVALTLLEPLSLPSVRLTWNTGVLLGLVVPLALLALAEAHGGIRELRVPEILRIDRI